MVIRKILCLCLALMLCFAGAFAESDLQAQLDEANAKIAELQLLVDKYYPFYAAQIVATYGEDGVVWLEDVTAEYETQSAQYTSMGLDLEGMGLADLLKTSLVETAVEDGVILAKGAELGLDQLEDSVVADMETEARNLMDSYNAYYISYFYPDAEETTEEMTAEAEAYWAANGLDYESTLENLRSGIIKQAVYDYATKDVAVTDEDIQAEYKGLLADNEAAYTDEPASFTGDYGSSTPIAWIPEGYRAVKQVLVGFDDEQSALYQELQSQLASLNEELAALEEPAEEAKANTEADTEEAAPRTAEEINADIAACAIEVEALYSQLLPTAEKVIAEFEAGATIDELIEKYNTDPGMTNEPTATIGYAVSEATTSYDDAFKQAAMSIEEVGSLSEPAYGSYGIYIVYYLGDIAAGPVELDSIREGVEAQALAAKLQSTYDTQLAEWIEAANVEYFLSNFGVAE